MPATIGSALIAIVALVAGSMVLIGFSLIARRCSHENAVSPGMGQGR